MVTQDYRRLIVEARDYAEYVRVPCIPQLIISHAYISVLNTSQRYEVRKLAGSIPCIESTAVCLVDGVILIGGEAGELEANFFRFGDEPYIPVDDPFRFAVLKRAWLNYEPEIYKVIVGRSITPAEHIQRRLYYL